MYNEPKIRTTRWQWLVTLGIVGVLLVMSPVPGHAWYVGVSSFGPASSSPWGPTGGPTTGPHIPTIHRLSSLPLRRSMSNPLPRHLTRFLLLLLIGIIVRSPRDITRRCNSALVAGNQSPRSPKRPRVCSRAYPRAALATASESPSARENSLWRWWGRGPWRRWGG